MLMIWMQPMVTCLLTGGAQAMERATKPAASLRRPARSSSAWQSPTAVALPSLTAVPAMPSPEARLVPGGRLRRS